MTGSARSMGVGFACVFAKEGARVVIKQVKDEGDPPQTLQALQEQGAEALLVKVDVPLFCLVPDGSS